MIFTGKNLQQFLYSLLHMLYIFVTCKYMFFSSLTLALKLFTCTFLYLNIQFNTDSCYLQMVYLDI